MAALFLPIKTLIRLSATLSATMWNYPTIALEMLWAARFIHGIVRGMEEMLSISISAVILLITMLRAGQMAVQEAARFIIWEAFIILLIHHLAATG